ncbi:MAG: hypothetical protein D6701_09325 [Gemmatimonadetes bacterium]|nr:MAG: hypothetical protein D6701_09325 [Gemmatimonadota bacterium]
MSGAVATTHPDALREQVARLASLPVADEADAFVDALRARWGEALEAVVLYGSTLHHGDLTRGLVDFYVLVRDYRSSYRKRWLRAGNALLAPNVFYLEVGAGERVGADPGGGRARGAGSEGADVARRSEPLRAKYAVMSLDHFERACGDWFHPYIWARFAQPARLVFARDDEAARRVRAALATAVVRFLRESAPLCAPASPRETAAEVGALDLWQAGLAVAYASELRTERDRQAVLTQVNADAFRTLTAAAAPALADLLEPVGDDRYRPLATPAQRSAAVRRWRWRRRQGRVLSIARLVKAAFTFDRGADYLAWKIRRHTGVEIEVTPLLRRHPVLFGPRVLVALLRRGVVR